MVLIYFLSWFLPQFFVVKRFFIQFLSIFRNLQYYLCYASVQTQWYHSCNMLNDKKVFYKYIILLKNHLYKSNEKQDHLWNILNRKSFPIWKERFGLDIFLWLSQMQFHIGIQKIHCRISHYIFHQLIGSCFQSNLRKILLKSICRLFYSKCFTACIYPQPYWVYTANIVGYTQVLIFLCGAFTKYTNLPFPNPAIYVQQPSI